VTPTETETLKITLPLARFGAKSLAAYSPKTMLIKESPERVIHPIDRADNKTAVCCEGARRINIRPLSEPLRQVPSDSLPIIRQ
jgi:hypothetical protein